MTRPDLDSIDEISEMVRRFYHDVNTDDLLGPVFNDIAQVDWGTHLPKLTAFWARALLGVDGYQGNPYARHADAHAASPLTPAHFERWLTLFETNLDSAWAGPNTERARTLVHNVARVHATQLGVIHAPHTERRDGNPRDRHPVKEKTDMRAQFAIEHANCGWCMRTTAQTLLARPAVTAVHTNAVPGCIIVDHDGDDPDALKAEIERTLHGFDTAANGETVMTATSAVEHSTCPHHHRPPARP